MSGVLINSSVIRNKHLQQNLGLYKAYDGTINESPYCAFITTPLKRINRGSLYDYTHNELTDYSKNIEHLYFKHRSDFQPYMNIDPINPQNFWGGEYHDYYDYVNAVYTQISPPIQFIEGLLSTQFLDEAMRVTSPAIVHNPEPTLSMVGVVKTNVNNFSGTDTRTGLLGNQMYGYALYHGANFNYLRKESNTFINNSITPTVRQRFGNSKYTINLLSSIVSVIKEEDGRIVEDYNEGIKIYDDISDLSGDINPTNLFTKLELNEYFDSNTKKFKPYGGTQYMNGKSRSGYDFSPSEILGKINGITQHIVYNDNNPNKHKLVIDGLKLNAEETDVPDAQYYITEFDNYIPLNPSAHNISNNSLLYKTNKLFQEHKINTIYGEHSLLIDEVNNIGFGNFVDTYYKNTTIDTSTTSKGRSRGRNLKAKKDGEINGIYNPFCRTWTYHHQYDRMDKLIRPLSDDDGNIMTIEQTQTLNQKRRAWNALFGETTTGEKYLAENTVLNNNGMVNIAPSKNDNVDIKKCMFSIENLAWKDVLNKDVYLSKEQRGPNGGRIMWFPPYDLNFSENTNVNWEQNTFIGRGEKVYTYSNTDRTGTLSFTLLIDHPSTIYTAYTEGGNVREGLSDEDILRFFAGCSAIEITENEKRIIPPPPPPPPPPIKPEPELVSKTTNIYVYFPNNYSGHYKTPISSPSEDTTVLPDDDFLDYMIYGVNADLRKPIVCESCGGSGLCGNCNGEGKIPCDCDDGFCKTCEGEVFIECEKCRGLGYVLEEKDGKKVYTECSVCKTEGTIKCPDCDESGKCSKCNGEGKVPCHICEQTENSEITEGPNKGKHKCGKCDGKGYTYPSGNKCTAEGCEGGVITQEVQHKCTVEGCEGGLIKTTIACTCEGCSGGTITKTFEKCDEETTTKQEIAEVKYSSETQYYYSSSLLLSTFPKLFATKEKGEIKQTSVTGNPNTIKGGSLKNVKLTQINIPVVDSITNKEETWGSIAEFAKVNKNKITNFFNQYLTIKLGNEEYTINTVPMPLPLNVPITVIPNNIKLVCFNNKSEQMQEVNIKLFNEQTNLIVYKIETNPYFIETIEMQKLDNDVEVPKYNNQGTLITKIETYRKKETYLIECRYEYVSEHTSGHNLPVFLMVNDENFTNLVKGLKGNEINEGIENSEYTILNLNTLEKHEANEEITHHYLTTEKSNCQTVTVTEECPECDHGFIDIFTPCTCKKGYTYENVYSDCTVCNGKGIIPYKIINPRGYEMSAEGLSIDQIDGETVTEGTFKCCKIKAQAYTECTEEGENTFYYRTDFDLKQNNLRKETSYKDSTSFKLNSDIGDNNKNKGDFTFAQLAYTMKRDEGAIFNAFLEYMSGILTDEDKFNNFKEKSEELYNILSNSSNISKITLNGSSTKQDPTNSDMLAIRRGATIKHLLEKSFPGLKGKIEISTPKKEATGLSTNTQEIKENRHSRIEIEYYTAKTEDMFDSNIQIKEEEVEDISKKSITTDYEYTRYENEAQYFSKLKSDSPLLYNNIVDKFKYFTPAFHSVSPEGFNARLTFLQQCTRQGHTIEPKFTKNNLAIAGNLSFGRMPVCILRIGDFIYSRVLITSMSINYGDNQWDLNPEGAGVQPIMAKVNLGITILGGQSLEGPISKLQNAVTFNHYANAGVYDDRADRGRPVGDSNKWSTDYYYTWEPKYPENTDE